MNEQYDAFTGGTVLGGLRTRNDIRVLLCYILKSLGVPFSKTDLNTALQTTGTANFFEVNDALGALCGAGLATADERGEDPLYTLTDAGREVADRLETDLPRSVREKAVAAAMELLARNRARGGTEARVEKLQNGYHVILSVKDGDTLMMRTTLFTADSLQADNICERFQLHPETLYAGIVELLTR